MTSIFFSPMAEIFDMVIKREGMEGEIRGDKEKKHYNKCLVIHKYTTFKTVSSL